MPFKKATREANRIIKMQKELIKNKKFSLKDCAKVIATQRKLLSRNLSEKERLAATRTITMETKKIEDCKGQIKKFGKVITSFKKLKATKELSYVK